MTFLGTTQFDHEAPAPIGILLTNVGTPEAPTAKAVRPYLAQFLGDKRVIEWPGYLWKPVLHGIILNTRPRKSAELYKRVWTDEGSPLLTILQNQSAAIQARLEKTLPVPVKVTYGMRYGEPSIASAMRDLKAANVQRLLVLPMFPQYSATTTATSLDAVFAELQTWRWIPELRTINSYHDNDGYIRAMADSIEAQWAQTGRPDRLMFSFHGIPRDYFLNGDPYYCQCQKTARLIAEALQLPDEMWFATFQSRFGPQEWLQPYTDVTLEAWGAEGVQHVDAICPGFSADCLETTDEVGHEGRIVFQEAGGGQFNYIPALNDQPDHINVLADIVTDHLAGWLTASSPDPDIKQRVAKQRQELGLDMEATA
jgi:ferrochelatase